MTALAEIGIGGWMLATLAYASGPRRRLLGDVLVVVGILAGLLFLGALWSSLGRPPMRTLGETRWWYAVLVPTLGFLIGWRFQTRVLAIPACLMGAAFGAINLAHPETMDRTLMPALQSPWFVPHVVVYMVAYSALGLSSLIGAWFLAGSLVRKAPVTAVQAELPHRLVLIGFPLLTCGLAFGAIWAKEAWGHYWTWDPKETWALITWGAYLVYLHVRGRRAFRPAHELVLLVVGFAALMGCWFGVNYMPSARESVHTYTQTD